MIKEDKYIFKCNWGEENQHCHGKHEVITDFTFLAHLMYRLIFHYGLTIDEKFLLDKIEEYKEYVNNQLIENEKTNGENISHYSNMDLDAEFLIDFLYKNLGKSQWDLKQEQNDSN